MNNEHSQYSIIINNSWINSYKNNYQKLKDKGCHGKRQNYKHNWYNYHVIGSLPTK